MTMHKSLQPKDDVYRLYASWNEGGRELTSTKYSIDTLKQRLKDNKKKHGGKTDYSH